MMMMMMMMMMGGRGLTRRSVALRLWCPILRRFCSRQVASDALESQSSPPPSPMESRLRTILRNEIQYQYDYAPPHPHPHQPFTEEFGRFVVEDVPGQQLIRLRGKWGEDENIKIEATMFDGSILAPKSKSCGGGVGVGVGDEEGNVRLHMSMIVDIWRGEGTEMMEFICSAWSDSLEIHKVYMINNSPAQSQPQPQPQPYMGPNINKGNNRLRSGLYEFLNARGINGDLSRFLYQYMLNKDRVELIRWLEKLQFYIEK